MNFTKQLIVLEVGMHREISHSEVRLIDDREYEI